MERTTKTFHVYDANWWDPANDWDPKTGRPMAVLNKDGRCVEYMLLTIEATSRDRARRIFTRDLEPDYDADETTPQFLDYTLDPPKADHDTLVYHWRGDLYPESTWPEPEPPPPPAPPPEPDPLAKTGDWEWLMSR